MAAGAVLWQVGCLSRHLGREFQYVSHALILTLVCVSEKVIEHGRGSVWWSVRGCVSEGGGAGTAGEGKKVEHLVL